MFKELIGTMLLCGSLGAFKPKENLYNVLTLHGSYCIRDSIDISSLVGLSASLYIGHQAEKIFCSGVVNNYFNFYELGSLDITIYDDFTTDLYINEYDGSFGFNATELSLNSLSGLDDFSDIEYGGTAPIYQNFILHFADYYTLTGNEITIFNAFFTSYGNNSIYNYNGWYNYVTSNRSNNNFTFKGMFIVNNSVYNTYVHNTDVSMFYNTINNVDTVYRFNNGATTEYPNIQINALIPPYVYNVMNYEGAFNFIADSTSSTWQDMIFSVMDAPIYYLTQLFNFELFGINLFVAFSSLLTLVIIFVVIRKVI